MAGGIWTSQNKRRPGAYINFTAEPDTNISIGNRGAIAMPLALSWGVQGQAVLISSTDLFDGTAFTKTGIKSSDNDIEARKLIYGLKYASKAYVYNINQGGVKASVELYSGVTATANYPGVIGNEITVVIGKTDVSNVYNFYTLVDGIIVDSQSGSTVGDIKMNEWLSLTGEASTELQEIAGISLLGGSDGTAATDYTNFFNAIAPLNYHVITLATTSSTAQETLVTFIKSQQNNYGRYAQGVVWDYATANHEAIISVDQGFKTIDDEVNEGVFMAYVAGIEAGASISESRTYFSINEATSIINPKTDKEIEDGLASGKLILSERRDGVVVIESDINTLHTFNSERSYIFSQNRSIRTLYDISSQISTSWETNFIGKINNDDNGRNMFKSSIIAYCTELQNNGAITNFSADDVIIKQGDDINSVLVELYIQINGTMEKLYMTVKVGG